LTDLLGKLTFVVEIAEESLLEVVILALGINCNVHVLTDAISQDLEQFVFGLLIIEVADKDLVLVDLDKFVAAPDLVVEAGNVLCNRGLLVFDVLLIQHIRGVGTEEGSPLVEDGIFGVFASVLELTGHGLQLFLVMLNQCEIKFGAVDGRHLEL